MSVSMLRLLFWSMLGTLLVAACPRPAQALAPADENRHEAATAQSEAETEAYCGISVSPMDPVVSAHLPGATDKGRGVVIAKVLKGSPADRAGLQRYDIVIRYDDQDVYSPEQLVKLVRNDQPGREVPLTYVRRGKIKTATLTLGEAPAGEEVRGAGRGEFRDRDFLERRVKPRRAREERERQNDPLPWARFESLAIRKLENGKYQAEIDFRDENGEALHREYTGSREEIRKALEQDEALPQDERQHLLRSLDQQSPQGIESVLPRALRDLFDLDGEFFHWPHLNF